MNNKRKKMFDIKEFLRIYGSRENIDYRKCKNFLKDFYNIVNNHIFNKGCSIEEKHCDSCYCYYYYYFDKNNGMTKRSRTICGDFANNILPAPTSCRNMKKAIKYFIDNYDNSDIFLEIE